MSDIKDILKNDPETSDYLLREKIGAIIYGSANDRIQQIMDIIIEIRRADKANQERREQSAAAVRSYLEEVANSAAMKAPLAAAQAEIKQLTQTIDELHGL